MTPRKHGARRATDPWTSYRANARESLSDAETKLVLLGENANAKGIAADAVLAAIGYGDAITVQRLGEHNAADHAMLPRLVERSLGKDSDPSQVARLKRILQQKSRAQYGGAFWTRTEAEDYLEQVRRFSGWCEAMLSMRD